MKTFINLVIPTSLLGDNRLTFLERLLLIEILSLCRKLDYCWATNNYFSNLFDVSKQTISKSISSLSRYNYIVLEYDKKEKNNSKRKIKISAVLKKEILGIKEGINTSIQNNFKQYNKNNIKRNNIGPIISKDVDGVELWNGKRCESKPLSESELKELEVILKEIQNQGDE